MVEESSIRDEIEAAWAAHEEGDTEAVEGKPTPELDSPDTGSEVKEPEAKPTPTLETKEPVTPEKRGPGRPKKVEAAPTTPTPAAEPIEAPRSWKAPEREAFSSLPRHLQETISKREIERDTATNNRLMELSRAQKRYAEIDSVLAPHEEKWAKAGIQPGAVMRQFLAWQDYLDRDPQTAIKELAGSYGLNLAELAQKQPTVDPEVARLRQELAQVQGTIQQQQTYEQQQYQTQLEQGIEAYATEIGTDGKPVRPYFQEIWSDMLPIVSHLVQAEPGLTHRQVLDQAYERAMWMNPQVRERLIEEKHKAAEAKRIAEMQNRTQKAKAAAVSVRGSPTSGATPSSAPASIRDSLESAWDSLT